MHFYDDDDKTRALHLSMALSTEWLATALPRQAGV